MAKEEGGEELHVISAWRKKKNIKRKAKDNGSRLANTTNNVTAATGDML